MEGHCTRDDTIISKVYPLLESSDSLTHFAITYNSDIQKITQGHVWYYEPLRLVEPKRVDTEPLCLHGDTCFRDCIDDEWFIVGTLMKLTELHPHLVISVEDNDGQFLLIETAHCIPKWLKPETACNRIFIHSGKIHIVAPPSSPSDVGVLPVGIPSVRQSLQCIRNNPSRTLVSEEIQRTIRERIEKSHTPVHSAQCLVPVPAAHILSMASGQIISAVVHAFCDRDKEDMQVIRKLRQFSPQNHQLVLMTVSFHRLLYAKLCNERWSVPTHFSSFVSGYQHKTAVLGMKLTCGLEILSERYGGKQSSASDVSPNSGWSKFLSSLCEKGYFQGELEGSRLYQELLAKAKDYYSSVVENEVCGSSFLEEAGTKVSELLSRKDWKEEDYVDKAPPPSDDDSWLDLTPGDLDRMMAARTTTSDKPHSHSPDTSCHSHLGLEEMAYGMRSFVDRVSSVDGAEFPWSTDIGGDIKFDPDLFVATVGEMLDRLAGDNPAEEEEEGHSSSDDSNEGGEEDQEMMEVMEQLSKELSSFSNLDESESVGVATEEPVDVDYNLVHNLLESYSGQEGGAGPASNIMNTLGIKFPTKT